MVLAADDLWQVRRYLKTCTPETLEAWEVEQILGRARRIRLPLDVAGPIAEDGKDAEVSARTIGKIIHDRLGSHWRQLQGGGDRGAASLPRSLTARTRGSRSCAASLMTHSLAASR